MKFAFAMLFKFILVANTHAHNEEKFRGAGERVFVEKVLLLKAFATRERRNIESRHPLAGALPVHGVFGEVIKNASFFIAHFFFLPAACGASILVDIQTISAFILFS